MPSIRPVSGIGCLLVLAGFAWAGLAPFDPTPENRVHLAPEGGGLRFERGVAMGRVAGPDSAGCTLEIHVRPAPNRGSSVLVDFYDPDTGRRLGLEQRGNEELRLNRRTAGAVERLRVERAVVSGERLLVTATLGADGARLYLDGALAAESESFRAASGDCAGAFTLGTGAASDSTWRGDVLGLAVHRRALSVPEVGRSRERWLGEDQDASGADLRSLYLFEMDGDDAVRLADRVGGGELGLPAAFALPLDRFLYAPGWAEIRADGLEWLDIFVNVFGFAPLGFFLYPFLASFAGFRRAAARVTLALGLGVSLSIETLQYWLPTRTSSLVDVLTNVLGTGVGAVAAAACLVLLAGSRVSSSR